jgi:3-oxoacyl-[acyl-carrier protein] reductase
MARIRIFINNAGIACVVNFSDIPVSFQEEALEKNSSAAYLCSEIYLTAMMRRKWGVIIKISSTRAKVGECHLTVCFAAKHGWVGLTWPLALEASRSAFTVNAISRS